MSCTSYVYNEFNRNYIEISVGVQRFAKILKTVLFFIDLGHSDQKKSNGFLMVKKSAKVMCKVSIWYRPHY